MTAFIRVWAKACNALTRKTTTQATNFAELKLFFLDWNSEYRLGIGLRRRLNRKGLQVIKANYGLIGADLPVAIRRSAPDQSKKPARGV